MTLFRNGLHNVLPWENDTLPNRRPQTFFTTKESVTFWGDSCLNEPHHTTFFCVTMRLPTVTSLGSILFIFHARIFGKVSICNWRSHPFLFVPHPFLNRLQFVDSTVNFKFQFSLFFSCACYVIEKI